LVGQGRFHHQPVKAAEFHGLERLPPASNPPRILCRTVRFQPARLSTPLRFFAVSRLELGPRPPPRPQPKWLFWARRLSLTSATKEQSPGTPI
jgi:hypothetical protein